MDVELIKKNSSSSRIGICIQCGVMMSSNYCYDCEQVFWIGHGVYCDEKKKCQEEEHRQLHKHMGRRLRWRFDSCLETIFFELLDRSAGKGKRYWMCGSCATYVAMDEKINLRKFPKKCPRCKRKIHQKFRGCYRW